MTLRDYCISANSELKLVSPINWAETYVKRRMEVCKLYYNDMCMSTAHGVHFFDNVLNCMDGAEWKEEGQLGNNFRKLIKRNQNE